MDALLEEFSRLQQAQGYKHMEKLADQVIGLLEAATAKVEAGESDIPQLVSDLTLRIKHLEAQILQAEKDTYSSIHRYGKQLDRTFKVGGGSGSGGGGVSRDADNSAGQNTDNKRPIEAGPDLDRAVLMHLARSGEFDVAQTLMLESQVTVPDHLLVEFAKMYDILQHVHSNNLGPAIEWATSKHQALQASGSNLEFTLHKLEFISRLVSESTPERALKYAQAHLSTFCDSYLQDVSQLMTSILYAHDIGQSPYREMFAAVPTTEQLYMLFSSEFCSLLGLPPESPLLLAAMAGSIALPKIAKVQSLMRSQGAEWTTKQELPVEIALPGKFQYHAIFVCPVSKEQSTQQNPPMLLPCGHVLCRDSLKGLSRNNPHYTFKCPYCPREMTQVEAKQVFF